MRFILFLDDVGAEFTKGRTTGKDVVANAHGRLLRFTPDTIRPLEVIDPKSTATRAAGGYLLLGPLGAALGVLTGKGPQVVFELTMPDGSSRKGIVAQSDYPHLRKSVEAMRDYKPGQNAKTFAILATFLLTIAVFTAAIGPAGLIVGPLLYIGVAVLLDWSKRPGASA